MTSARNRAANEALHQQTLAIFARLKYDMLDAASEQGGDYTPTGREHDGEVVLKSRLRAVLPALNQHIAPAVREQAIETAINILTENRALLPLAEANRQVYKLLKDGVQVKITPPAGSASSEEYSETVQIINWKEATANDILLVSNFWVNGHGGRGRLDFVGFVNGLGSLTAPWEHFTEWKRIEREGEAGDTSLQTLLTGTCEKTRLLDIVENFTLFSQKSGILPGREPRPNPRTWHVPP